MYVPFRAGRAPSAGRKKFPPAVTRGDRFAPVVGVSPIFSADARALTTLSTGRPGHRGRMTGPVTSAEATPALRKPVAVTRLPAADAVPAGWFVGSVSSQVKTILTCDGGGDVPRRITPAITRAALGGRPHGEVIR